ncbi:phosphate starvation-inducible protein PhoH [Isoptericola sp. JC619]|uniref:PhoH-like protein n=1 Tax=Isoptericola sediminis TaxID=2733572 RepID=A0A849K4X7_9MICO|nr:phosphate starvation-inducible protein PhoH [Isoptericola sediminis]
MTDHPRHATEHRVVVPPHVPMVALLGSGDSVLRAIEDGFPGVDVHARGNEISVHGPAGDVALVARLLDELVEVVEAGTPLTPEVVSRSVSMLTSAAAQRPAEVLTHDILSGRGRTIRPKTVGQKRYVEAIAANTITFGIGPAGTGKTYLAMAKAVQALQAKQINRIVLTRPAVEAGEKLGYLPGSLSEKIDPYLRPLYDALHDMLDPDAIPRLVESGTIEVAPLAYMRGRAQPYDAKVLTPDGFRPFGSLRVGDLVVGSDGRPTPVVGIYPQGPKQTYRVTASDGSSTVCCGEHLWTVRTQSDKRRGRSRTVETQEMIGREWYGHTRRFELPVVDPVEMPTRDVPMDPYALGLMLGDGSFSSRATPSYTTADPELADALESALPDIELVPDGEYGYVLRHVHGHRGGVIVANPVKTILRRLGLDGRKSATKFVPEVYKVNAVEVRLAVLQGLLDTDGGPVAQTGRTCRVQYTTTSRRLRDDVVHLVRSLGGVATTSVREAEGRTPGRVRGRPVPYRRDAYVVEIRLPDGVPPFRLTRKARRYAALGGGRPMRTVDSILPAGVQDTMCIQVAAEDSLYVTDDFLVTHNTINDAFIILDEAQNTSAEQMKMFLTRLGFGSTMVITGDATQVDLPGGTASGLRVVEDILTGVDDVEFCRLTSTDVVRHRLVSDIVDAYARWDSTRPADDRRRPGRHDRGGRR